MCWLEHISGIVLTGVIFVQESKLICFIFPQLVVITVRNSSSTFEQWSKTIVSTLLQYLNAAARSLLLFIGSSIRFCPTILSTLPSFSRSQRLNVWLTLRATSICWMVKNEKIVSPATSDSFAIPSEIL